MKKLSNKLNYHESMDVECIDICDALNSMKGIMTNESCCGHNREPFRVWFSCQSLEPLKFIQSCIDKRYWIHGEEWSIRLSISDTKPFLNFVLESKSKDLKTIVDQVESMIDILNYFLNHKNRFELLGQKYENFIFDEVD